MSAAGDSRIVERSQQCTAAVGRLSVSQVRWQWLSTNGRRPRQVQYVFAKVQNSAGEDVCDDKSDRQFRFGVQDNLGVKTTFLKKRSSRVRAGDWITSDETDASGRMSEFVEDRGIGRVDDRPVPKDGAQNARRIELKAFAQPVLPQECDDGGLGFGRRRCEDARAAIWKREGIASAQERENPSGEANEERSKECEEPERDEHCDCV